MKADFSILSHENCALYLDMAKYLSEKHLKRSDYDRVCEDIFLMISDAQERGESAESLFPDGMQEFCDEVAANCAKEKWYMTLLNTLFWAVAVFSAVIFVEVLFVKIWADDGEWVSGVNLRIELSGLLEAFLAAIVGIVASILSSKFVFKKFIYDKKLGYYFYVALTVAVAIAIAAVFEVTIKGVFLTFNWVALAVGSLGAAAAMGVIRFVIIRFSRKKQGENGKFLR